MHVSRSRTVLARFSPPPWKRAAFQTLRQPAIARGSPTGSPSQASSSSVYVVDVHFGL